MKKIVTAVAALLLALLIIGCQDINDITRQRQLESISLDASSAQTEFVINKTFSSSGLIIYGRYSDNTVDKEPVALATFKGFDSSALTESQLITVSYKGFSASYTISIVTSELKSVEVTTKPKLIYNLGDTFDSTGMVVTGYYSDGSTSDVTADCTVVNFESKVSGHKLVSVVYSRNLEKQISAVLDVYVSDKALKGISLAVNKTAYALGEQLASDDLTVYGIYNDEGTDTDVLTTYEVLGFDSSTVTSSLTVTIKVNDFTESYAVSVQESLMTGIQVESLPSKTIYGHGETLDLTGLVVTGIYADGVKHDSGLSGYTVSTLDTTTDDEGVRVLTVTYQWKNNKKFETTFQVAVTAAKMTSISVLDPPASIYQGETLSLAGKVLGVYTNNTTCQLSGYTISGYDPDDDNAVGTHHIVVTYNNTLKFKFDVEVKTAKLTGIEIYVKPSTLVYFQGESFTSTGLQLKWTYTNGTFMYPQQNETLTYTDISAFTPGVQEVVIAVEGNTDIHTSVYIVVKKILSSITLDYSSIAAAVQSDGTCKGVARGAALDLSNLKVTAHYTDDSTCVVSGYTCSTDYVSSGSESTAVGKECTVTVSYTEGTVTAKDCTFKIKVTYPVLEKITVSTLPAKTKYIHGDLLDVTGMKLTLSYTDGSYTVSYTDNTAKVGKNGEAITVAADSMASGTHICTISAAGVSTTMNIQIIPKLTGIRLDASLVTKSYPLGTDLDLSKLVVYGKYDDSTEAKITDYTYTTDFDNTKESSDYKVTVTIKQNDYKNDLANSETDSFGVGVSNATLLSIKVTTLPSKLVYAHGSTDEEIEEFKSDGIGLIWKYSDNKSYTSPQYGEKITYPSILSMACGYQLYTFSVSTNSAITASITIHIVPVLESITLDYSSVPREYFLGKSLDLSSLKVTAKYSDSSTAVVTGYTIGQYDLTTTGEKTITVSYTETDGGITKTRSNSFTVNVIAPELLSVNVTTYPTKLDYYSTDTFAPDGMVITYRYTNGNFTARQNGETITYPGFEDYTGSGSVVYTFYVKKTDADTGTALTVPIHLYQLQYISLNTNAVKLSYPLGIDPGLSNLVVTAKYSNDDTVNVPVGKYTVGGDSLDTEGNKNVTVTYEGKSATFSVNVKPAAISSLVVVSNPLRVNYYQYDDFDSTGMVIKAVYTNGDEVNSYTNYTCSWNVGDFDTTGNKTIIIKPSDTDYPEGEVTASVPVTVSNDTSLKPTGFVLYDKSTGASVSAPVFDVKDEDTFRSKYTVHAKYSSGAENSTATERYSYSYTSQKVSVFILNLYNHITTISYDKWGLSPTFTVEGTE